MKYSPGTLYLYRFKVSMLIIHRYTQIYTELINKDISTLLYLKASSVWSKKCINNRFRVIKCAQILVTCRTYPCTSWTQKIWPANSADSCLFMKIDWHTALVSYNQPAFRQDVKWILTFLYKQRRILYIFKAGKV